MKAIHRGADSEALSWLARARAVHVAGTTPDGRPLLRTLHTALVDGAFTFHGAVRGEKTLWEGRRVVIACEHIVARIPSYFRDPERACPATTYYLSAEAEGIVERVHERGEKARALSALMARHQPEGGHVPITEDDPLYQRALEGLWVVRVRPDRISGKKKLGQERAGVEIERIAEGLWRRGSPEDLAAIDVILNAHPERPLPPFLRGPAGSRLCPALSETDLPSALGLLRDQYWNVDVTEARLERALRGSSAWVGARDENGALVATARANADGGKRAELLDVAVASSWRRRGLGDRLLRLLLDHPAVRDARTVNLRTRDAQTFYARFGFASAQPRHEELALIRR